MNALQLTEASATVREINVQGSAAMLPASVYSALAPAGRKDTLVVFFHGGGFCRDRLDLADALLRSLVEDHPGMLIVAPRYSLAPAGVFPAPIEDAHAVLLWAKSHQTLIGWTGKRLFVAGVEAGANLATVANQMAHDRRGPLIDGQILITPMLDASLSSESMRAGARDVCESAYRSYLPHAADRMHPYASPLQSSRLRHLAPALIISAQGDPLADEAEQYADRLGANGVATLTWRLPDIPFDQSGGSFNSAALPQILAACTAFLSRY